MRSLEIAPEVREIINSPDGLRQLLGAIFKSDSGAVEIKVNNRIYTVEPSFGHNPVAISEPTSDNLKVQ